MVLTILKNMKVNRKDDIPYMKWKNKSHVPNHQPDRFIPQDTSYIYNNGYPVVNHHKSSISMCHGFHGYVSHNQRVKKNCQYLKSWCKHLVNGGCKNGSYMAMLVITRGINIYIYYGKTKAMFQTTNQIVYIYIYV